MDDFSDDEEKKHYGVVDIRNQQRNGRKSLTLIEGLPDDLDLKRIVKEMTRKFSTGGSILDGSVIQLNGDVREAVKDFLVYFNICQPDEIKVPALLFCSHM